MNTLQKSIEIKIDLQKSINYSIKDYYTQLKTMMFLDNKSYKESINLMHSCI